MSDLLKEIMAEFDKAKDDAGFDGDHPILQMAEHIDSLTAERDELIEGAEYREQLIQKMADRQNSADRKNTLLREAGTDLCNKLYGTLDDYEAELDKFYKILATPQEAGE